MNRDELIVLRKELREALADLFGSQLETLYLYGSQARGDAKPDSDIDVLVVLKDDFDYFDMVEYTGQTASKLSLRYDTVISLAFTSREKFKNRRDPFLLNVHQDGVLL